MVWDQAIKDRVCALWKDGNSAADCGRQLTIEGHYMTRGAAMSIVDREQKRLGLVFDRISVPNHTNGGYHKNRRKPVEAKPVPPPPPPPPEDEDLTPITLADGSHVTLETVNDRMCRFPSGEPSASTFCLCGRAVKPGSPYCIGHSKIAYQPLGATAKPDDEAAKTGMEMRRSTGQHRAFGL